MNPILESLVTEHFTWTSEAHDRLDRPPGECLSRVPMIGFSDPPK